MGESGVLKAQKTSPTKVGAQFLSALTRDKGHGARDKGLRITRHSLFTNCAAKMCPEF
jgi:hypothetical protein